jgi:hypothetical protein
MCWKLRSYLSVTKAAHAIVLFQLEHQVSYKLPELMRITWILFIMPGYAFRYTRPFTMTKLSSEFGLKGEGLQICSLLTSQSTPINLIISMSQSSWFQKGKWGPPGLTSMASTRMIGPRQPKEEVSRALVSWAESWFLCSLSRMRNLKSTQL